MTPCDERVLSAIAFERDAIQKEMNTLKVENAALREALRHQRNALVIVRDRQGGGASIDDINQGIRQIDAALAAQEKP